MEVLSIEGHIYEDVPVKRDHPKKAWVNIMYGCDEFCTYCIVPYTRGKERSRRPESIINEVKKLVEQGYVEVTLLGQNVNAYGKDLKDLNYTFADLLKDLNKFKLYLNIILDISLSMSSLTFEERSSERLPLIC